MKYVLTLNFILFFLSQICGQNFSKIDDGLINKLNDSPYSYHEVFLHLSDRIDLVSALSEMRSANFTKDERARLVVTSLRSKSKNTQKDVLKHLHRHSDLFDTSTIVPLWITNAIKLKANRELIYLLSSWDSIEKIYDNFDGHTTIENQISLSSSDQRALTNGVKAINAPAMWKLGYTGYGKKAFVMDSGGQADHPAIQTQFAGNQIPFNQAWTGGGDEPFDVGGHGTHVTGTILGLDRKNRDTIGVAFNATWIGGPVQFSNSPTQPHFVRSFVENMQFALDPDGNPETTDDIPDVFNNSWGHNNFTDEFCNPSAFFSEVHLALEAAGVAMVWSAGNNGSGPMSVTGYMNSNFDLVSSFAVGNVAQTAPFTIAGSSSRGPSRCGGEGSLLIKPEVSAPGINVRSSYLNGGYAQLTGTSMSAPHVSGAVLLLKEAFPYLAGEEILMALYLTAIDLGEPGEDNDYGMGIIDVLAAFNFLIDNGNTPIPPTPTDRDLVLNNINIPKSGNCLGLNPIEIEFSNNGSDTIFYFQADLRIGELSQNFKTVTWEGSLLPGASQSAIIDSFEFINPGNFYFQVTLSHPNHLNDQRELNNSLRKLINISPFEYLDISTDFLPCLGGRVTLSASNTSHQNNILEWYSEKSYSNLLGKGDQISIPTTSTDQSVYVLQYLNSTEGESLESSNFIFDNLDNAGLLFNANEDFYLKSVTVKTNDTGNIFYQILNSNKSVLTSKVYRINNAGINTIDIDVFIPKGSNYRINVINGRILGSSSENVNFPYTNSNIVEIFGAYQNSDIIYFDKYNYFYDWEITKLTCNATEYVIPIDEDRPAPHVEIIKSIDTIFLSNPAPVQFDFNTTEIASPSWDFGNGETSIEKNPFVNYTEKGNYDITLILNFDSICTVYTYTTITVVDDRVSSNTPVASGNNLLVFPNPFDQSLTIKTDFSGEINIQIFNTLGQIVKQEKYYSVSNQHTDIHTSNLPGGSYFLYLSNNDFKTIHKIFKF